MSVRSISGQAFFSLVAALLCSAALINAATSVVPFA